MICLNTSVAPTTAGLPALMMLTPSRFYGSPSVAPSPSAPAGAVLTITLCGGGGGSGVAGSAPSLGSGGSGALFNVTVVSDGVTVSGAGGGLPSSASQSSD